MLILTQDGRLIVNTAYVFEIGVLKSATEYRVTATISTGNLANVQTEDLGTYPTEGAAESALAAIVKAARDGENGYYMPMPRTP